MPRTFPRNIRSRCWFWPYVHALGLVACGTETRVGWELFYDDPAAQELVSAVRYRVFQGGCPSEGGMLPGALLIEGYLEDGVRSSPSLPEGRLGFSAEALMSDCRVLASGCVERDGPADGSSVFMALTQIPVGDPVCTTCGAGRCDAACDDVEHCNGFDDDCDGAIDEELGDVAEQCDGIDQDCDGHVDEGGTLNDPANCGACGWACGAGQSCLVDRCQDDPIEMSVGDGHVCVLLRGGYVLCDGEATLRGAGTAPEDGRASRVVSTEGVLSGVVDLEGSSHGTCATTDTGALWCWGSNQGQRFTGDDSAAVFDRALVVATNRVTSTSLGATNTQTDLGTLCTVRTVAEGGKVLRCRGANRWDLIDPSLPRDSMVASFRTIELTDGAPPRNVTVGREVACTVDEDGDVACWGRADLVGSGSDDSTLSAMPSRVPLPGPTDTVKCSTTSCCANRLSGETRCWGENRFAEASGSGANVPIATPRVTVDGARGPLTSMSLSQFGIGIDPRGALLAWGSNDRHELIPASLGRVPVLAIRKGVGVRGAVAGAPGASCFTSDDREVRCRGDATDWLGVRGAARDTQGDWLLSGVHGAAAIDVSGNRGCALRAGGELLCWGQSPTTAGEFDASVAPLDLDEGPLADVAVADSHTCGVGGSGTVRCVGTPLLCPGPDLGDAFNLEVTDLGVTQIKTSRDHVCLVAAMEAGSAIYCWGNNDRNQARPGSNTPVFCAPERVTRVGPFVRNTPPGDLTLALGTGFSCVVNRMSGEAVCWGDLSPASITSTDPTPIASSLGVRFQTGAAAEQSLCLVDDAGSIYCAGSNLEGQAGCDMDRCEFASATPLQCEGGAACRARTIDAGTNHYCMSDMSGVAHCWGSNANHQVSRGNDLLFRAPQAQSTGHVVGVAAGDRSSCALESSGAVRCWGSDILGERGDGAPLTAEDAGPTCVAGLRGGRDEC